MKKLTIFLSIFFFCAILFPLSGLSLIEEERIDNIAPPEWIIGIWVLEEEDYDPFFLEFTEDDILMDYEYSMIDDIDSDFVVTFIQEITDEYYDIFVKFEDGAWYRERFFKISDDEMESHFIASDNTNKKYTYYRYED